MTESEFEQLFHTPITLVFENKRYWTTQRIMNVLHSPSSNNGLRQLIILIWQVLK